MSQLHITPHKDQTSALIQDTLAIHKQALVFCSSKRNAESQAEKTAAFLGPGTAQQKELAHTLEHVLTQPTKQCIRLAHCVQKGIAFHHAGLVSKQRELLEDGFRTGILHTICSTPTLAAGLDLPAFRAIVRDYKRFGQRGMAPIPVLEYVQMAGRAGRPGKETYGEAILIAQQPQEIQELTTHYVKGVPEDIYSKLAVEPVLRTYVLSLVATKIITSISELYDFFDNSFYAQQFKDTRKIHQTLNKMVLLLEEWGFLKTSQKKEPKTPSLFSTGLSLLAQEKKMQQQQLQATHLGIRISEMYIDPLTAHILLRGLHELAQRPTPTKKDATLLLTQLCCCALEMRPLLRVKAVDVSRIQECKETYKPLYTQEDFFEFFHDDYEETWKTALFFHDWMCEYSEDDIMKKYGVRPGEISYKKNIGDWLLYVCSELARMEKLQSLIHFIRHARFRLKHGVREELIALLQFKGVGRVRARQLFEHKITGVIDVKKVPLEKLVSVVGPALSISMKEEAGVQLDRQVIESLTAKKSSPKKKVTGQLRLGGF